MRDVTQWSWCVSFLITERINLILFKKVKLVERNKSEISVTNKGINLEVIMVCKTYSLLYFRNYLL